jgi:fructose-bisphosphate aldolase, class I
VSIGKSIRLGRLFAHPSGRLCSIAVDHFINYVKGRLPDGLRDIRKVLTQIVAGRPDAITMQRGLASSAWEPHAGKVPLILQTCLLQPDDSFEPVSIADPEEAVRMGADAVAVVGFVRGPTEVRYMKLITDCVRAAARWDLPVVCHIYPRKFGQEVSISYEPEDVAWAVRVATECGVDVVKVPYCNDVAAYGQIVSRCPVPVVAAGGPRAGTLREALGMLRDVIESGARGATVGRNVWGFEKVTEAVLALKAVIHDGKGPDEALAAAGLR